MRDLAISCFGPFSAALDGAPITAFESAKVRALLVCLAVEPGTPHPRSTLGDLLWSEQGEENARRNLSQALYNLRSALGERASSLTFPSDAVQLDLLAGDAVDVVEFSRLIQSCDQHLHHHIESCPECQDRLQAAARLYRGEFLEGFYLRDSAVFEEWRRIQSEAYHQYAVRIFASLLACHERLGNTHEALQAARRLAELDPYNDRACQALMRLLAAAGQRTDALAAYEHFRRTLQDELELEPEAQTRLLYERLRLQNVGEPAPGAHYSNLPASLSPLIGRESELAEVQGRLLDPACRLLTILGPGGSGKSRLALEAGRGLLARFADGVFLVPLSPLISQESLLPAIASAVGLQIKENRAPLLQLQDYLRGKELLLLLDGCEGLLGGVPLFLDLLRGSPYLKLLATSRARLNVEEEQVYNLVGLQVSLVEDRRAAAACPAVRLFSSAARRLRPGFELDEASLDPIVTICAELRGMPLAILLAAAWVEVLSPQEILTEVRRNLDFLQAEWADLPARQHSMRLTFDYSWGLLGEDERRLFQGLCIFRGAFTRQAAEVVASAGAVELRRLADKSLLMLEAEDWFAIHALLRQYGLEKLNEQSADSFHAHQCYSAYFLDGMSAWETGLKSARQGETLAKLDVMVNDVRAAWEWASQHGEVELLSNGLGGYALYYELRARFQEGQGACQEAAANLAAKASHQAQWLLAHLLAWQSRFTRLLGELDLARQLRGESLAIADRLDTVGVDTRKVRALLSLEAAEAVFTTDLKDARAHLERSVELYRQIGDDWCLAGSLAELGINLQHSGEYSEASNRFQECVAIRRASGDPRGLAYALYWLAFNYARGSQFDQCLLLMQECMAIKETIGDKSSIADGLMWLGRLLIWQGLFEESAALFEKALPVYQELGDRYNFTFCYVYLELNKTMSGEYALGERYAQTALRLARENSLGREIAVSFWTLGCSSFAQGKYQEALERMQESVSLYRQVGHQDELGWALSVLGNILYSLGQPAPAKRAVIEALQISLYTHAHFATMFALAAGASILAREGQVIPAVEYYTHVLADHIWEISPWMEDFAGRHLAAAAAGLPPEEVAAARERGRQRPLWEAVAELQERLFDGA